MALIAPQPLTLAGLTPVYTAPSASDTITPDTGLFLHVKNTNAATRDITVVVPGNTTFAQAQPDVVVTVPATTGDKMIPLPSPNLLADPTTGLITVTCTPAQAGVTMGLFKAG